MQCASILLILTLSGENQFVYFTTYLFVGGMICTLVLQTDLLNRAIMAGDTLSVFPMFQCFWIGVRADAIDIISGWYLIDMCSLLQSSVIGGVVFYEKYSRFTIFEWVCLPIALACTYCIAPVIDMISCRQQRANLQRNTIVIIVGIYLLSKHGEDDDDLSCDSEEASATGESHHHHHLSQRGALTSGHFGALMPLSPQHHSHAHPHKSFDAKDEHTPLRAERRRTGGSVANGNNVTSSVVIIRDRNDEPVPKSRRGSM